MEEMLECKGPSRRQKNKVVENKSRLQERSPIKIITPQDHSTPLEAASTAAVAEYGDGTEDEDDQFGPFNFYCTQDAMAVGWGCGSPQQRSSKKLGSKVKRKLPKENSFVQKKHGLKSCSPVEPLRPRRRFNIEKPASDFSEIIPELQVIADLVNEMKDQNDKTTQNDERCVVTAGKKEDAAVNFLRRGEGSSSGGKKEELASDVPEYEHERYLNETKKMKDQRCVVSPPPDLNLLQRNQRDVGSETFTALFDDDEDEFMLRCSQEIEEKLNENLPVVCSGNSELPLPDYKNNDRVSVESLVGSPKMHKAASDLKHIGNGAMKTNSPKVGTKYYVRIKSGTTKYSRDDHCHSQASHNHSSARVQIRYGRTNTASAINSKPPPDSEIAFNDSFDAVIQNLTEADIEMLSQGCEKKRGDKETGKQSFQKADDRTQMNSKRGTVLKAAVGQSLPVHRPSLVNDQPVHEINSSRPLKHVNHGNAANDVGAPATNKAQFRLKVPSRMCNNQSLPERLSAVSAVQVNKPHSNKVVPLVNNKMFLMRQGQSAAEKNSYVARPGSSAGSISLPCKYYVRIKSGSLKYARDENCASGFSVNCLSASVQKCHDHPEVNNKFTEEKGRSKSTVNPPCSILDTL
ncbi:uncharacterized protein LOC110830087 isoform X2 [Zootermopsis nevadensis]|uniref:uncharacterized protein LOC110830087 isoform X2 n=1 Tax=Zootermopsis nevadensis TaxID=136037 RepID=UPI000B8E2351|nr:uncharacterized protein LOC110830087 isoform X2 [Zootermopsis nevadensis]